MAIVYQLDKRVGITYVYDATYYWDKEKKQSRAHRKLIGKLDPKTGEVVKTDGRGKRRGIAKSAISKSKKATVPAQMAERRFYGATYLLDQIGEHTGVIDDLKACFPTSYKQMLSVVYYLILEGKAPLSRFWKWGKLHEHPYGKDIPLQKISELFQFITEDDKIRFLRLQCRRRVEEECWVYDATSISSYSQTLKRVEYGKNEDNGKLPRFNLALLFGGKSGLPFYYRPLCGNITDVKTVNELLKDLDVKGYKKFNLVMGGRVYSEKKLSNLCKEHYGFIRGISAKLSCVEDFIQEVGDAREEHLNYDSDYELCVFTKTIPDESGQKRPYQNDMTKVGHMYLHLYFNVEKRANDILIFNMMIDRLKEELLSGERLPEHEKDYRKYFIVNETPDQGITIQDNQDAVRAAQESCGFFALISNEIKDPITALRLYRNRDVVEEAFGNLKDRLSLSKTLTSSESFLGGKLFIGFVALIFLSYIKEKMDETGLFSKYTLYDLLDELDVIECCSQAEEAVVAGKVPKRAEGLYRALDVKPLSESSRSNVQ